jgi:hypothetical protein
MHEHPAYNCPVATIMSVRMTACARRRRRECPRRVNRFTQVSGELLETLLAANRVLTERDIGVPEAFLEKGVRVILAGLGAASRK